MRTVAGRSLCCLGHCSPVVWLLLGTVCVCREGIECWEQGVLGASGSCVCLPPSPELAAGQLVPFTEGEAKWHWICFCSPLRAASRGERSRQLRALPGGVGCAALSLSLAGLWRAGTPAPVALVWPWEKLIPAGCPRTLLFQYRLCVFQSNEKYNYAAHIP